MAHCSDIFHAKSFVDVAQLQARGPAALLRREVAARGSKRAARVPSALQHPRPAAHVLPPPLAPTQALESLAVTFMSGHVPAADLAPLEGLLRLRRLTLSALRHIEEDGTLCLQGFPEPLLKLRGLTSLALSSMGAPLLLLGCGQAASPTSPC